MTTVGEVCDAIDAFKEDMKKLGVYVYVSISPASPKPVSALHEVGLKMKTIGETILMEKKVKIKENIALVKMLKALDNNIRLLIVEHILNSHPASRTYIHKVVEEARGIKTSKGFIAYHLSILTQTGVLEKRAYNEYQLYHVTPETVATLEHHGLLKTEG